MKVFLGGTCNGSTWRDELIPMLKIDYFNPVVEDWTEADQQRELIERATCDYVLYTITPNMIGVYSIAEVVDDSNKRPEKTLFCLHYPSDAIWNKSQRRSLQAVAKMVADNGALVFDNLKDVADHLNTRPKSYNF